MGIITMENVGFHYLESKNFKLENISIKIKKGEFVVVMGDSGSGKSTLLKLLKKELITNGKLSGNIYFEGKSIYEMSDRDSASKIGYVMQDPEAQIVTDKVWSELAFGLENIGLPREIIRSRIGEMANYFGIHNWYRNNTVELSGGQKQLLNLASVLVMQPEIIVLDEPTAQLDPLASLDFLKTLQRINTELNTTIIIAEHYLEEVFGMADKLLIIDRGQVEIFDTPSRVAKQLLTDELKSESLPAPIRLHYLFGMQTPIPLTLSDGIRMVNNFFDNKQLTILPEKMKTMKLSKKNIVTLNHVFFKYSRNGPDILHDINLEVNEGEVFCILGGNGAGKSTLLKVMAGLNRPYEGRVDLNGHHLGTLKKNKVKYGSEVVYLPQQPLSMFVKETVKEDFINYLKNMGCDEVLEKIEEVVNWFRIKHLLNKHPYDLSGGELQLVALAKVTLMNPKVLFLDEPTKGVDTQNKRKISKLLKDFAQKDKTVVVVTHDIDFSANVANRCGLFFDRQMISISDPITFFSNNYFYTTPINKMLKSYLPNVITYKQAKYTLEHNLKGMFSYE